MPGAAVLERLGGRSEVTGCSHDGGIDFIAYGLTGFCQSLPLPKAAELAVVGQAKRYAEHRPIKESDLRHFVGGAAARIDQMRREQSARAMSPIVLAFWSSSSFDQNALEFARQMGLWYMDGIALAKYVDALGLRERLSIPAESS